MNDLGGARDGTGKGHNMADHVVEEIKKAGGEAAVNYDDVSTVAGGQNILKGALAAFDRVDLLVNNASRLGPSPQPPLHAYPLGELERVYAVNVIAPLALAQLALPRMDEGAMILNVTSDAAVEAYEGWGGYGSSKAALEQMTRILAAEHPQLRVHAVDPGDMTTQMHQEAFPGEDISDRPPPEDSVPGFIALIEGDQASGRFQASRVAPAVGA